MRLYTSIFALGLALAPMAASAQGVMVQGVITTTAPPAPLAENPGPAPGQGFVWVSGFWNWTGSQYAWTAGRWQQPPQPAQAWEPPQWERQGQGYRFRPGRWGGRGGMQPNQGLPQVPVAVPVAQPVMAQPVMGQPAQTVYVQTAPPRPRFERRTPPPGPGQTWIPGFWSWNGSQHVWTAGRWEAPPRPQARWVPPQWGRHGRNWNMTPGRWR